MLNSKWSELWILQLISKLFYENSYVFPNDFMTALKIQFFVSEGWPFSNPLDLADKKRIHRATQINCQIEVEAFSKILNKNKSGVADQNSRKQNSTKLLIKTLLPYKQCRPIKSSTVRNTTMTNSSTGEWTVALRPQDNLSSPISVILFPGT
jgi:hypothetical protein